MGHARCTTPTNGLPYGLYAFTVCGRFPLFVRQRCTCDAVPAAATLPRAAPYARGKGVARLNVREAQPIWRISGEAQLLGVVSDCAVGGSRATLSETSSSCYALAGPRTCSNQIMQSQLPVTRI